MKRELVKYTIDKERVCPISINTNLTLWKPEDFEQFRERNVSLSISVPSMLEDEYIEITKANTFNLLKENLKYVNRKSIITIIVNPINLYTIEKTVSILEKEGFTNYIITPQVDSLTKVNYELALKEIETVSVNHSNLDIRLMSKGIVTSSMKYDHTCDAGLDRLVIMSNGDVVPCACCNLPILGNVLRDSYDTLIKNGKGFFERYPIKYRYLCKGLI